MATLHAAASYNKLLGTLTLDGSFFAWTPSSSSSKSASAVSLPISSILALSVSKAGSATTALQVTFDQEGIKATGLANGKMTVQFAGGISADKDKAVAEREEFKAKIIEIINVNKSRSASVAPTSKTPTPAAVTPRPDASGPSSRAVSAAPGSPAVNRTPASGSGTKSTAPQTSAAEEFKLRVSLLKSNPSLSALHKQTVMSGLLPDAEFWSHPTRQALLRSARQSAAQKKGRNARIVDPRFESTGKEAGLNLELTAEDRHDLLEQNDVLRLAYEENVPDKLDESAFWHRYFTSSLYHVLRTSSRSASLLNSRGAPGSSSAKSTSVRPDDIFDSYLPLVQSKYVDTLEAPASTKQRDARNRLIDLGATEGDHQATGNEKDWTMRGGAERSVLPLVRRFNEHSERILTAALGEDDGGETSQSRESQAAEQVGGRNDRRKKARTEGERGVELDDQHNAHAQRYEQEIVIEDLEERRERMAVPLELAVSEDGPRGHHQRSARKTAAGAATQASGNVEPKIRPSKKQVLAGMEQSLRAMPSNGVVSVGFSVASSRRSKSSLAGSVLLMEQELRALLIARKERGYTDLSSLSDAHRKKTMEIQGTATEVMRQFWSAVSPPDEEESRLKLEEGVEPPAPLTEEEREAKAKRMMGILEGIPAQVEKLLHETGGSMDEDKIASVSILRWTGQARRGEADIPTPYVPRRLCELLSKQPREQS